MNPQIFHQALQNTFPQFSIELSNCFAGNDSFCVYRFEINGRHAWLVIYRNDLEDANGANQLFERLNLTKAILTRRTSPYIYLPPGAQSALFLNEEKMRAKFPNL